MLVSPSAEGKRRHTAVFRRRVDAVCRILSAFDADEPAQLAGLLGRFVDAFDELVAELATEADGPAATETGEIQDVEPDQWTVAPKPAEPAR